MNNIPIVPINTLVSLQPVAVSNTTQNPAQNSVLANIPNGTLLAGFVIRRDAQNQPILRTEFGDVLITTPLFLKTGTEVSLRVDATQPNHARLLTINGQSPEAFAKLQATQSAIIADEVAPSAVIPSQTQAVPRPVQLAGMLLKLQPDADLPPQLLETVRKALGITRTTASEPLPVDITIRAVLNRPQAPGEQPTATRSGQASITTGNMPGPGTAHSPTSPLPPITGPQGTADPIAELPQPAGLSKEALPTRPVTSSATNALQQSASALPEAEPLPASLTANLIQTSGKAPALQPVAVLTQQNLHSAQSIMPQANEAIPSLPNDPIPALARRELAQPVQQAKLTAAIPLPLPDARSAGDVHPAFRDLVKHDPVTLISSNTLRMDASVIGQEAGGDTVLHSPIGILKAFTAKPLPAGTKVEVEVKLPNDAQPLPQGLPSSLPKDMKEITQLARDWPALANLLDTLKAAEAPVYQELLQHTLPTTGRNLTHGLLFFLTALKGGELRNWVGAKAHEAIEQRQTEMLKRLAGEFLALQQASVESSNQGWMSTVIPVMHESLLHQARLFIRQEAEQPEKSQNIKSGQRFIIEVDLTQLGEMQFDGFVLKDASRHQFDMVVRSTRPLPLEMQQDIRDLYDSAAGAAGFKGMLTFQSAREQFVRPLSSMQRDSQSGILA